MVFDQPIHAGPICTTIKKRKDFYFCVLVCENYIHSSIMRNIAYVYLLLEKILCTYVHPCEDGKGHWYYYSKSRTMLNVTWTHFLLLLVLLNKVKLTQNHTKQHFYLKAYLAWYPRFITSFQKIYWWRKMFIVKKKNTFLADRAHYSMREYVYIW